MSELERLARLVGVEDELNEPGAVPEIDEDEAAVVAAAVDPARDADLGVDPIRAGPGRTRCRGTVRLAGPGTRRSWR